jgi:hypothetical protein
MRFATRFSGAGGGKAADEAEWTGVNIGLIRLQCIYLQSVFKKNGEQKKSDSRRMGYWLLRRRRNMVGGKGCLIMASFRNPQVKG